MINSRQIVEIIKDEMNKKENSQEVRMALKKVKERIEILEEIDYVNTVKQPFSEEPTGKQSKEKQTAAQAFEDLFGLK
jgi:hypothetical protein|tara:strand:+ start:2622 stop:2855 length:234 start_codon:yes stop_codon:yes gene_type:complete